MGEIPGSSPEQGMAGGAVENRQAVDKESVEHLKELVERLREERDQLWREARTDELTGLPNRRFFKETLRQLIGKANLFVVLADLDGLKEINDKKGHSKGDEALKQVAEVLKGAVRKDSDMVARIGGDEFVILGICSPGTHEEQIVPSLRERVDWELEKANLKVSMGAAKVQKGEEITPEMLIEKADRNMYQDKNSRSY